MKVRMIFAFLSATFTFYAYYINHLAIATTLIFTSPIFTAVFGKIFLEENVNRWDIANMVSSVFGIMLLFDPFNMTQSDNATLKGVVFGILAAFFIACNSIVIWKVNADFHPGVSIFYSNIATTFGSSIFVFWQSDQSTTGKYTVGSIIIIIFMVLFGFLSQYFISVALKYEKAGRVATMRYVQILFAFLADIIIFKTDYGWNEISGSVLILFFGILIFVVKMMTVT
jgi:drug/metabolite transporter (DMT)-like permease